MSSRITRATFTVVSFAGLVLVGVLFCSLNAGRANAQRISAPSGEEVTSPIPIYSPAEVAVENRYHPTQQPTLSPWSDRPSSFDYRPYNPTAALSMQPIVVAIKDGPQLHGEPVALSALQVKTIFGPVSIPLDRIAGVRIADDSRQPATICLSNGDSLTGVLATDAITIKTEWGSATIARDHIVSIATTAEPMTWQQKEGRWRIIPIEPVPRADDTDDTKEQVGDVDARAQPPQNDSPTTATPSGSDPTDTPEPGLN